MKKSLSLNFLMFWLVFAVGCGGGQMAQPVTVAVTPQSAAVGASQSTQFTASVTGDTTGVTWSVNGTAGGNSTVGTIDGSGNYTAPAVTANSTATVTATSKKDPTKSASAAVTVIAPGIVAATANVQVASYTITPPSGASVSIQFGPDTNYGLATSQQSSTTGGAVTILVAGMKQSSTYHVRAVLTFPDSSVFNDVDHTFATGALPATVVPAITATTTAGATPQGGVELLDLVPGTTKAGVLVTNLNGEIIWSYNPEPALASLIVDPVKLLANGHFLINFSAAAPEGANSVLREVDLAGQTIWQITAAQLNQALAAATCPGCNIVVTGTHHDFAVLPNGHIIVLAVQTKSESGLVGFPTPINVDGDVLIDLDENHNPVWVWSEFDHLDLNRHPINFPDWTHSNAVIYSPDDKNLIVSIRHQHWAIKIDYNDGQGSGNILWKLGYQGDFSLQNGTDPQDWFYAQHDVNIASSNSSGIFEVLLFDNGNQRVLDSSGTVCGTAPTCFSRVPLLQLDETAKTASIEWVDNLAPAFSVFGGSARMLANGNIEFAECAPVVGFPRVTEVTKTTPPQTVWQMQVAGQSVYRGFRIPSLYPGVQW